MSGATAAIKTWAEKEAAVDAAAATFPAVFGLRGYPGDRFRIERRSSFYSDDSGVQLVVQRFCRDEAERIKYSLPSMVNDFTRDTAAAIRIEMVVLELPKADPAPMWPVIAKLTGRCANGAEGGSGSRSHVVMISTSKFEASWEQAICGAKPGRLSNGWAAVDGTETPSCGRCARKLAKGGAQ